MYQITGGLVKNVNTGFLISQDDPGYREWLARGNTPVVADETLPRSFIPGDLLRELRSIGKLDAILALLDLPQNEIPKTLFFSYPELKENDPEFQAFIAGLVSGGVLTESEVSQILNK